MSADVESIRRFEALLADTLATFSHEHAPFIRTVLDLPSNADVSHNVGMAFLGHLLEHLYHQYSRAGAEAILATMFDKFDHVHVKLAEASARGRTLDPAAVALELIQGKPVTRLEVVRPEKKP